MADTKTILVTGGAGYIGSHICYLLKKNGFTPVCFDNLSHGHEWAVKYGPFVHGDLRNSEDIQDAIAAYKPHAVIHMASFIQVGESVQNPLKYYENNLVGAIHLLKAMEKQGVRNLVFSSTAAVYGSPQYTPMDEAHPCAPINPYGLSKLTVERILQDCGFIKSVSLRYFNAAGAMPEEGLGEAHEPETHLIPLLIRSALGNGAPLRIFGNDYETPDGTCVRDYVHVLDIAKAHVQALAYLDAGGETVSMNLGTGKGHSNLEVIQAIEKLTKKSVPYTFAERRAGDPAILVSTCEKAKKTLGWQAQYALDHILTHAWQWHEGEKV
jgi:UDP-glucose-4-epimerase GalE